ncbi:hypothetical protein [Pseudoalteromonas sp. Of7M-16]|uniref:hypothetical protein n=1 Tax=Pseudoalteromonas sp. Of7M-16 TaxID=2917756 RepID=UPI001EF60808|nr:hypothetical protein [Pseudoalteromonas sp. Of7M-16]MCG7551178.1 hypothetical protein [Pseudoalteromonas sp. Of7M-16]
MNRYNRNKRYDEARKKVIWLLPLAVAFAVFLHIYGSINPGISCLIAILTLGVVVLLIQFLLSLKYKLMKTQFGEYDKAVNVRKYTLALVLCFIALCLNTIMLIIIMTMIMI